MDSFPAPPRPGARPAPGVVGAWATRPFFGLPPQCGECPKKPVSSAGGSAHVRFANVRKRVFSARRARRTFALVSCRLPLSLRRCSWGACCLSQPVPAPPLARRARCAEVIYYNSLPSAERTAGGISATLQATTRPRPVQLLFLRGIVLYIACEIRASDSAERQRAASPPRYRLRTARSPFSCFFLRGSGIPSPLLILYHFVAPSVKGRPEGDRCKQRLRP